MMHGQKNIKLFPMLPATQLSRDDFRSLIYPRSMIYRHV